MLIQNNQITVEQLKELKHLKDECFAVDLNSIPLYVSILTQQRDLPCNLLYYHQGKLIGFLSAFHFYSNAFEIVLLISPNHRQQGLAKALLKKIIPLLKLQSLGKLIFPAPSTSHFNWIREKGGHYLSSEFELLRKDGGFIEFEPSLNIRLANEGDIPDLVTIDNSCFDHSKIDMYSRFYALLGDPHYSVLIAFLNNLPIGKAHLYWEKKAARLSDIAILPAYQGKGYGKQLLSQSVNFSLRRKKTIQVLDVESNNKGALKLYTGLGFQIINACDYWSFPWEVYSPLLEKE